MVAGTQAAQEVHMGFALNVVLAVVKITGGWYTGSAALFADGVNSAGDSLSGLAAMLGLRVARQPADIDHPYGHQRAETVAALLMALLMAVAGAEIGMNALSGLRDPGPPPLAAAAGIAMVTVVLKTAMHSRQLNLGRRLRSHALVAMAVDHGTDAMASLAVLLGVVGARAGWPWLDPLAGLAVAAAILRTAFRLGKEGVFFLMDGFDEGQLEPIRSRIQAITGVQSVIDLRARYLGTQVAVDVVIGVDPQMSVDEAHKVAERVERSLVGFRSVVSVMVHVEPV